MRIIAELKSRGIGHPSISAHRMAEIFAVSDRISLVKDGRLIGPMRPAETSVAHISGLMSRGVATVEPRPSGNAGARRHAGPGGARPAHLQQTARHRLLGRGRGGGGPRGLVGSGRSTLAKALFGLLPESCR